MATQQNHFYDMPSEQEAELAAASGRILAACTGQGDQAKLRLAPIGYRISPVQSPEQGVLPMIHAATSAKVCGMDFIGPAHFFEMFGPPALSKSSKYSNETAAAELWSLSERLVGISLEESLATPRLDLTGS